MRSRFRPVILLMLSALLVLAGCAPGSPGSIAMDSPEQLRTEESFNLCAAYGFNHGSTVLAELQRRGVIRPQTLDDVKNQKVAIGMSPCEVLAAWERPNDVYQSITPAGTLVRWIYRDLDGYRTGTVYFNNDVVIRIEN